MHKAYYNDIDPKNCDILQGLIDRGLIMAGDVDCRSIETVVPESLQKYTRCHFFAGIGGWDYAAQLAGVPHHVPFWTGSCPCQPFSVAGRLSGVDDERHLWPSWAYLIKKCRPPVIFGEQVTSPFALIWLDEVSHEMESLAYAFGAAVIPACGVGAPHIRERTFWTSYSIRDQQSWAEQCGWTPGRMGRLKKPLPWNEPWQSALPRIRAMVDGLPRRVDWTDGARNAIVPQVAAYFMQVTIEAITE